jgi:ABC-2 type transport system ATP-binding protein
MSAIEFQGLWRHFAEKHVLCGLDLAVQPGQVFALLGRNGAGKTTALRILLGLLEPHEGAARILGKDSRSLAPEDRDCIGYVAEGHRLYVEMRVRDAVSFEAATRPRFERAHAERELARCGLDPRKRVWQLSRGQRAQLALILAAAGKPDVLVFDDPAMGLDVAMRRDLLGTLIELLSERGCAVLFSSHILSDVERIADRVGVLHGGRLIVDAPLDELKRRVQKRHWVPKNGSTEPELGGHGGVLRARRADGGFELTLLDLDGPGEAALREQAAHLSERHSPDLEELFLDLTSAEAAR